MTGYFASEVRRQLRRLAADRDTTLQALFGSVYPISGPCCDLEEVDDGLRVTVNKPGRMTITLSSDDAKSATLRVTAYQVPASLEVLPGSVSLEVGETATLSATIKDANGYAIGDRTIYWTTANSAVARVEGADEGGETGATATVTAATAGTTTVTARHAVEVRGTTTVAVTDGN